MEYELRVVTGDILKASIEGTRGRYLGRKVALPKARIDIGRDEHNSMVIADDSTLSRKHACILFRDEAWYCMDLGSSNGTFLNGQRVGQRPELIPQGGVISCGQQEFRITYERTILDTIRSIPIPTGGAQASQSIPIPPPIPVAVRDSRPSENTWYGEGATVQIHGCTLASPFVYIGEKGPEPSLINPKLPVTQGTSYAELPYWPSYRDLSPVQRWHYLKWLERGRSGHIDNGFLFIFFYGIERRVVGQDAAQLSLVERRALLRELEVLCERYPAENSFHHYCHRLQLSQWSIDPEFIQFASRFEQYPAHDDELYVHGMSCLALHNRPFTKAHALEWFQAERHSTGKVAAVRCAAEADYLFELRVGRIVGEGVRFAPGKSHVSTSYHPANQSLRAVTASIPRTVPRALEATKLINRMRTLATACIEELTPAAKVIGPDPKPCSKNRAELLFPAELMHQSATGQKLRQALEEGNQTGFMGSLDQLQAQLGLGDEPLKKLESALFDMCAGLGFVVEPDPRFTVLPVGKVARFAVQKSVHEKVCLPSAKTSTALRLALISSSILQSALSQQQRHVHSLIATAFSLSPPESQRLDVFLGWLAQSETKIVKSTSLAIEEQDRATSARVLLQIVQSSGEITPDTVKALTQTLTLWGWDEPAVFRSIHNDEPTLIIPETTHAGFSIPTPPSKAEHKQPLLNAAKLRELEQQTREVSGMLRDVFETGDDEAIQPGPEVSASREQLLRACIGRLEPGALASEQLSEFVSQIGMPIAVLIESINELAIETSGYPLIIGDGEYEVEADILAELHHE